MSRPGYLNVKEAALRYGVSRAKLHRLIKTGRLHATKDPRDERATLLRSEDLEAQFRFSSESATGVQERPEEDDVGRLASPMPGQVTPEWRASFDALRTRVFAGKKSTQDSVEIIREQREKSTQELWEAMSGNEEESAAGEDEA